MIVTSVQIKTAKTQKHLYVLSSQFFEKFGNLVFSDFFRYLPKLSKKPY